MWSQAIKKYLHELRSHKNKLTIVVHSRFTKNAMNVFHNSVSSVEGSFDKPVKHRIRIIGQRLKEANTKISYLEEKLPCQLDNEASIHTLSELKIIIESLDEVEIPKLQKQLDDPQSSQSENDIPTTTLQKEVQALKEELTKAKSKINMLEKENQQLNHRLVVLEERSQKSYVEGGPLRLSVQASQQHLAMSKLSGKISLLISIRYFKSGLYVEMKLGTYYSGLQVTILLL